VSRFTPEASVRLLVDSKRHCCLCWRWCGQRVQLHHIVPDANGGPGDYENGIPVCLDCHAEIESRSNMGRKFTPEELREHRDRWFATVRERPEVLIRATQTQSETGPLEALLAELEFNRVAVLDGPVQENFAVLATDQFKRAVATNALAALPPNLREAVLRTYGSITRVNYHFEEMARMDRGGGAGGAWADARVERTKLREQLRESVPRVIEELERTLGTGQQ
jgi:HNH endonuclease